MSILAHSVLNRKRFPRQIRTICTERSVIVQDHNIDSRMPGCKRAGDWHCDYSTKFETKEGQPIELSDTPARILANEMRVSTKPCRIPTKKALHVAKRSDRPRNLWGGRNVS